MSINYREHPDITAEELAAVFAASGINRPIQDLSRIQRMIDHASLIICAFDGEKIVGVARSLTDFSFATYLSDLAVDREYQRQGIGKKLIEQTRKAIGPESMLLLLAAPEAQAYYPHIGMNEVKNGWILPRTS